MSDTRPTDSPEATKVSMPDALSANTTIGVFDSGFGGLTVLYSLLRKLSPTTPVERYVFLGDSARLPYGSKSKRTIERYAVESARYLVEHEKAGFLVIACNTASALALDAIRAAVNVPVLGVIEPGARAARAASKTGDVLVVATDATVQSHAYAAACRAEGLRALEKACPLLVPLVEEGWTEHTVTAQVLRVYLDELLAAASRVGMSPDTLVLGCTHYPLIRPLIEKAVPAGIRVIDSAEATAAEVAARFPASSAESSISSIMRKPVLEFFATDSVEKFERLGSKFLGQPTGPVSLVDLGG